MLETRTGEFVAVATLPFPLLSNHVAMLEPLLNVNALVSAASNQRASPGTCFGLNAIVFGGLTVNGCPDANAVVHFFDRYPSTCCLCESESELEYNRIS